MTGSLAQQHGDVWRAIDALAAAQGMSASGLAIHAGLDPTSFNRSKRVRPDGSLRWPSTETIARITTATGTSFARFVQLMEQPA